MLPLKNSGRIILAVASISLLIAVYLFQRLDVMTFLHLHFGSNGKFIVNKTTRFLLNDLACIVLMAAIFNRKDYLRLGWLLFLIELVVLLPIYFLLKLNLEGDSEISSPLLSQLHRMIVNPLLMMVLIAGLFFQDYTSRMKKP